MFCEEGVFSAAQSERILLAGSALGLAPRLHADELVPSGGAELAAAIGAVSADHLGGAVRGGHRRPRRGRRRRAAGRGDGAAGNDVVPDEVAPRAGPDVHRSRHPGRDRDRLANVPDAVVAARDDRCLSEPGLTPDEALAAVTINAAFAVGRGEDVGSIEGGKAADLVIWRVPTSADPVLARCRPRPDGGQARPRGLRAGLGVQALPRDSRRTAVVSDGRLEIVTDRRGWGAGSPPISWKNFASASPISGVSSSSGIATTIFGSSCATSSAVLVAVSGPPIGTHAMSTEADVRELLLGQEVTDLAEVDRVQPVELDEERGLLAAVGALRVVAVRPDAGQQDVADLVLARTVEDERGIQRAREDRLAVS